MRPVTGSQKYVVAPPTVRMVEEPLQMVVLLLPVTTGKAVTPIAMVVVALQPVVVPVTVYVVGTTGLALTLLPEVGFIPVTGSQE